MRLTSRLLTIIAAVVLMAGCTTIAKYSLQDSLQQIGFTDRQAGCMADQLEDRLSDEDLQDLARHLRTVTRADSTGGAFSALTKINNPRVIGAATASGFSCALAPNQR